MKYITAFVFALSLFLFQPTAAQAEVESYKFDTAHTQILFFIDHMGFSRSQGEFHKYDGGFTFDRENPENSSIDVTIYTDSIDMDLERWDDHMKNEDFFHVEVHPTMTFKSTGIEITGENTANITGDFTLLGVTKPVTLAVKHNKSGDRRGTYVAGFSATTTIKRSEFGMNYGLPMVGDDVEVIIEVEGERVEPDAAEEGTAQ